MAVAIGRENFFWHKLHSLTGIIPVGFYVFQHLALNSFSLAGPDKYNGVSGFFYSMPEYLLWTIEIVVIYLPLLFHAIYGLFIVGRSQSNYFTTRYKWSQNGMYTFQRWSGIYIFLFLIWHVSWTTVQVKLHGPQSVSFYAMRDQLSMYNYGMLVIYALGVLTAAYHLSYGVWNFCIRWGITVSDRSQIAVQKFSFGMFVVVTLIGWLALAGFFTKHDDNQTFSASVIQSTHRALPRV
jgi:succinate dehydrogenase / fumarate reductase cytochrome b subunit